MIVDIIDVKFEKLNFRRSYDTSRYNRAKGIYNAELVEIKEVNQTDTKNYYIEAEVEGNLDVYTTTLDISEETINDFSCTCEDFNKGFLCKHILATSMEAIRPHFASTEEGKQRMEQEKKDEVQRRVAEIQRRQEEERNRRKYEIKYYSSLRKLEEYKKEQNMATTKDYLDLNELYQETQEVKNKKIANLATNIKIEPVVELQDSINLQVSFRIGQTRMYMLNSISQLYNAYKNQSEIYYGKNLRFIPERENFQEDSKELFDFIIKYAEMVEYSIKSGFFRTTLSKYIDLSGEKIDEFLKINRTQGISCYNDGKYSEYKFTDEKMNITGVIKREKIQLPQSYYWYTDEQEESEEIILTLNISDYKFLFSHEKIYLFYNELIYSLEKNRKNIRLLELFERDKKIIIPEDKLEDFKKIVLSQIEYIQTDEVYEKADVEALIAHKLATKILLDLDDNGNIILELKFCYMDYEFNVLERGYKTYVKEHNIVRDIPAETEVIKRLFMDGFELVSGKKQFIMKNTDYMYDLLAYKIQGYMNDFEVLVTDRFKNKEIRQPKISNLGVRIDNGLLELDFSKINIDISEIKDILKDYNIKKKYHKLKNGDLLDLSNNEDLNLLDEIGTTLDIDYSKIKNNSVALPVSRSLYLEKITNNRKDINIQKNEEYVKLIENVEDSENSNNLKIDKKFEKMLRDYQKIGFKWLKTLENYKFGGILADDMGLGKTIQIIALINSGLKEKKKMTSIVVCPSTLVLNWKAEVEKWCNTIKVLTITGNAVEREEKLNNYKDYDLVITSYDLLKRDIDNYEDKNFKYIIADEAQYIKNASTQNSTALKSLKGEIKFALTGTPIENSVSELWSIFDFIMPGYLYNYNKFKKKFEEPILKYEDKEALIRLKKLISPFILRRTKKDVLTELPEKNIIVLKNEMEEEQQKVYLSYLAQTQKEVAQELSGNNFEKNKLKILMLLTRLRQICCHPSLFIENYNGGSGKLKQCIDLLTEAINSGHKILLFSSYTSMFEIIEEELKKQGLDYFKLVGDTPVNKRIEMVDEFNRNDNVKVFLISLKAGGTGLNLTAADVVIHYDPWWNLSSENQATDRAYRIGQKNSVQVYKLITSNSIEEKINKMQERKEKLSKDILSTEETFINKLSKEDILDLFE